MPHPKHYARAAMFALAGFTGWTFSDALLKLVRTSGVPTGEILLISGLSGMVVIFLLTAMRGKIRNLQPRKWRGLFILGICQWLAFICWVAALPKLPLTHMYAISFLTPMTVAGAAALVLKEHLGTKRAVAIIAGFVGVIISANPPALMQNNGAWVPYLLVFASMITTATQMLVLRVVSQRETSECTSFYPRLVYLMSGTAACATTGFVAMPAWVFLSICASGVLGSGGWALLSEAYKNAPATAVAPLQYSQMITGALLGYLVWDNVPGSWLIAGAAIVIASGVYLVRHERRASRTMVRVD